MNESLILVVSKSFIFIYFRISDVDFYKSLFNLQFIIFTLRTRWEIDLEMVGVFIFCEYVIVIPVHNVNINDIPYLED